MEEGLRAQENDENEWAVFSPIKLFLPRKKKTEKKKGEKKEEKRRKNEKKQRKKKGRKKNTKKKTGKKKKEKKKGFFATQASIEDSCKNFSGFRNED